MAFAFRRCAVQATLSLLLVVVCLSSGLLTAEEFSGTIGAPGQATAKIPADVLTIAFLFETQSTSFAEAKSEAEEMQHRLQAVHIPIESVLLSTEYDYDTLKQRGFYWKKGSKVEHRITLTINGLPAESLHDTLAAVIDQTVDLSPKLTITDASSEVSESHLKAARTELLAEAVRDARANAEVIAKESGLVHRCSVKAFDLIEGKGSCERATSSVLIGLCKPFEKEEMPWPDDSLSEFVPS